VWKGDSIFFYITAGYCDVRNNNASKLIIQVWSFKELSLNWTHSLSYISIKYLVEWVGACSPVGEEQAEANGLEDTAKSADSECVDWSLLNQDSGDELFRNQLATENPL
jgi:hypothetical protein